MTCAIAPFAFDRSVSEGRKPARMKRGTGDATREGETVAPWLSFSGRRPGRRRAAGA